jgi:nucleoid-associated protein YgaU
MSNPIQGQFYTSKAGETLRTIANQAYGLSESWTLIRDANQFNLKTSEEDAVQEGESLFIPVDPDIQGLQDELRP